MGEHEIRRGGLVDHCLVREAAPRVLGKRHPLLRRIRDEVSGLGELLFRHLELDSAGLHGVDVSRFAARTFRCLRVRLGGAIVVRQPADLRCRVVFFRVVFETVLVIVLGAVFGLDRRIRVVALDGFVVDEILAGKEGHCLRQAEVGAGERRRFSLPGFSPLFERKPKENEWNG